MAFGMAEMVFLWVSSTYSVPVRPRANPVEARTKATRLAIQGNPEPTTVALVRWGGLVAESDSPRRTTVDTVTMGGPVLMVGSPPRALATKRVARVGVASTVMSHGPTSFLLLM